MIERELLEEMFASIREQTDWNVDSDLLWSFFFVAASSERLEQLAAALDAQGFTPVELARDDESGEWWLTVERVETHSVDSLHERNSSLEALAERHEAVYDGMDVAEASLAEKGDVT